MPSHVTHLLFAEECASRTALDSLLSDRTRCYLALGAQGPDIFYHNQRRKPSGLTYGSVMHRKGYGAAVSRMASWAWQQSLPLESWAGAWVVGFATHAILDRLTHPFINYFSGWVDTRDPHTERYRSMHPFLERLVDVAMLEAHRGIHPSELDFAGIANCGTAPPDHWIAMMASALADTYAVAANDDKLRERLASAYLDTHGYYRFTNVVNDHYFLEALDREQRGEIGSRWLSIVHPPYIPDGVDVLNERHAEWSHPCDADEVYSDSFADRYERALGHAQTMAAEIVAAWNATGDPEERRIRVERAVGNWNLSDGRDTERPCRKNNAGPLPLQELQTRLRDSIIERAGGSPTGSARPPAAGPPG